MINLSGVFSIEYVVIITILVYLLREILKEKLLNIFISPDLRVEEVKTHINPDSERPEFLIEVKNHGNRTAKNCKARLTAKHKNNCNLAHVTEPKKWFIVDKYETDIPPGDTQFIRQGYVAIKNPWSIELMEFNDRTLYLPEGDENIMEAIDKLDSGKFNRNLSLSDNWELKIRDATGMEWIVTYTTHIKNYNMNNRTLPELKDMEVEIKNPILRIKFAKAWKNSTVRYLLNRMSNLLL